MTAFGSLRVIDVGGCRREVLQHCWNYNMLQCTPLVEVDLHRSTLLILESAEDSTIGETEPATSTPQGP
jgi:hypothetical protein